MTSRFLLALLALGALTGCAGANSYRIDESEVKDLAHIRGYHESQGLAEWLYAHVEEVDGKSVSYAFRDTTSYEVPVAPGRHRLLLYVQFNTGWSGACPCHAFADAEAGFEPNGRYALGARRDGATVEMWIVDLATDEPIGPPVRASYQVTPQDVYVPVIVY